MITNTESNRHDLIVEAHPMLKLSKPNSAKLRLPMMQKLGTVSPSTFVCRPPLERIFVGYRYDYGREILRAGGVTFGAVIKTARSFRSKHSKMLLECRRKIWDVEDYDDDGELALLVSLSGAVVSEYYVVKSVRQRLVSRLARIRLNASRGTSTRNDTTTETEELGNPQSTK